MTPTTQVVAGHSPTATPTRQPAPRYQLTFVDSPNLLASIISQLRAHLREPKITVPKPYYRGEAALPVVEMRQWYRDLPNIVRAILEKPTDPIGKFNRVQDRKRGLVGLGVAFLATLALGLSTYSIELAVLGALGGYALGQLGGALVFKKRAYPPDIWRDYEQQTGSWVNSLLVHGLVLAAIGLPYLITRGANVRAATKSTVVLISPYVEDLDASQKQSGGGGGGGDRSPTPATKGAVPKFNENQLAPPMIPANLKAVLPVEPTLQGAPELKLPEMALNQPWGDPQGVPAPPSNGSGYDGGIGSGSGGGIGPGHGRGLGPGDEAGTGGGVYSPGGNVSAPIPIYKPDPPYSEEARKAKFSGTVVLWIVVDAQGVVTDVKLAKPLGLGLDEKAMETVRTWKFIPGKRGGIPVPVRVSVEVSFRLL